ncbi:hypothetical protein Cylst_5299 [Cylindrospermum stagnale PCC 7417]|uniref:Uncharacterized protein n=1 Tax=Cylindrospermum stagnale PCC 7417 TaxID=56107 RepID=K9X4D2_9NOST|nr:hypothetical protein [Cylindrospermum stagnale]AFZ27328.1 hypothetical protein Cylst_5299 [Cylindrospermum stagnale PCC 7417]
MGFIKKLIAGILGFITGLLPKKKKSNGYYLELDEATSVPKPSPAASNGAKVAKPVAAAAPVQSVVAQTPAPTAAKATKAKPSKSGKAAKAEPAPAPAPAATKTTKAPTETTFAPKYLDPSVVSSNGRRRPGANMNAYLDMASQVKTPG